MSVNGRRIVAIFEMLMGVIAFVSARVAGPEQSLLQLTVPVIVGVVSLFAGALLWQAAPIGRGLSVVVQLLQIPQISFDGLVRYGLELGAGIIPHVGFTPKVFQAAIYFDLQFGRGATGLYFGVNLLALVALLLITVWKPRELPKERRVTGTSDHSQSAHIT